MRAAAAGGIAGLLLLLFAAACSDAKPEPAPGSPPATAPATSSAAPQLRLRNPFGVMLPSALLRSPSGPQVLQSLGVVYYRPASVFLDRWDGRRAECDIALGESLKLVLTVRNSGPLPTAPPQDLATYRRTLAQVLEAYRPALLVVENEENSALFYTGTPAQYATQLEAACEEARRRALPIAVWFGLDGPQARGLVDFDGSLRPTGQAFRRFIEEHFGSR